MNNYGIFHQNSFSQQAEEKLLLPVFDLCAGEEDELLARRIIALYPGQDETNKTHAITRLMSLIWKNHLGNKKLDIFKKLELYLRATGQRDHYVHQFEVFLLGWNIFTLFSKKLENFPSCLGVRDSKQLLDWWLLTSMGHDIGYPAGKVSKMVGDLSELFNELGATKISSLCSSLVKNMEKRDESDQLPLLADILSDEGKQVEEVVKSGIMATMQVNDEDAEKILLKLRKNHDHGYISAMLIGKGLKNNAEECTFNGENLIGLKKVLSAIALHTSKIDNSNIIEKLDLYRNPFAYILFLADNIQEWSRPECNVSKYPVFVLDYFSLESSAIKLKMVLKLNNWSPQLVEEEITYIKDKQALLNMMPKPDLDVMIQIDFLATEEKINSQKIICKL